MNIVDILEGLKQYINSRNASVFKPVDTLPTASENTLNFIFLVPNASENGRDEYITIDNGEEATPRYTWDMIGSTTIDLDGYITEEQVNQIVAQLNAAIAKGVTYTGTQAKFTNQGGTEIEGLTLNSANASNAGLLSAGTFNDIVDLKADVNTLNTFKTEQEATNEAVQEALNNIPTDIQDCAKKADVESVANRIHTTVVGGDSTIQIKNPAGTDTLTIPKATETAAGVLSAEDYATFAGMEDAVNMAVATANTASSNAVTALSQVSTIKGYVPTNTSNNNKLVNEARLAQIPSAETAINIANQALNAVGKLGFYIANDTNEGNKINLNNGHSIVVATGGNGNNFYFVLPKASEYKGKFYILKDCRTSGQTFICINAGDTEYIYDYSNRSEEAGVATTNNLNNDGVFIVSDGQGWRLILAISDRDL